MEHRPEKEQNNKLDFYLSEPEKDQITIEGHPCRYSLVEFNNEQGLLSKEYVNIPSKQFVTLTGAEYALQQANLKAENEYRIKDTVLPGEGIPALDALPENVIFQKVAPKVENESREKIEGTGIWDQFLSFIKIRDSFPAGDKNNGQRLLLARKFYEDASANLGVSPESASGGSLEKINRIHLEHIGPHTLLTFSPDSGMIAVSGPNGAGKTFLMEAVFGAFYGDFPTYGGTIYDQVKQDFSGRALIEVDFISGGKAYRASRKITKDKKKQAQETVLYGQGPDGVWEGLTSGRDSDFAEYITRLVGTKTQLLASIFASQEFTGDLTTGNLASRQEFFHELLGLEVYGEYANFFKDKATALKYERESIEKTLQGLQGGQINAEDVKTKIQSLQAQVDALNAEVAESLSNYWAMAEEKEKCRELLTKRDALFTDLSIKKARMSGLSDKIDALDIKIRGIAQLRRLLPELHQTIEERNVLQGKMQEFKDIGTLLSKKMQIEAELSGLRGNIQARKTALQVKAQTKKTHVERLKKKLEMLDIAACAQRGEVFEECVFLKDAIQARSEIEETEREIAEIEKTIATNQFITKEEWSQRSALQAKINEIGDIKIPAQGEMQTVHNRLSEIVKAHPHGLEKQIAEIQASVNLLDSYDKTQQEYLQEYKELEKTDWDTRPPEWEEAAVRHRELVQLLDKEVTKGQGLRIGSDELLKEKVYLEMSLSNYQQQKVQIEEQTARLEAIALQETVYKVLFEAFDRRGIPQYLISDAFPHLQEIVDSLLEGMDAPYTMSFQTQTQTKGGKTKEDLEIMVTDIAGTRPLSRFSGGQKQLARLVLRIAITRYKAQAHRGRYGVIILDEPFRNLNDLNSNKVLSMLDGMQGWIQQGLVISHEDNLMTQFPVCYEMRPGLLETLLERTK